MLQQNHKDHGFAAQFSSNLLEQDWAIALASEFSKTREEMKQGETQNSQKEVDQTSQVTEDVRSPDSQVDAKPSKNVAMTPENWVKVAQAVGRSSADIDRINEINGRKLTEKAQAMMQKDFAKHQETLNSIRNWYRAAVEIEKPQAYLDGIQAIAEDFKNGTPMPAEVQSVMSQDLHEGAYKKLEAGLDISKGETALQEVAKRAFEMGMPPMYVHKVLLQGNQGLRDTHKVQPKQTEKYVSQVIGQAIKQLPEHLKGQVMKQLKALQVGNQKQRKGGISL